MSFFKKIFHVLLDFYVCMLYICCYNIIQMAYTVIYVSPLKSFPGRRIEIRKNSRRNSFYEIEVETGKEWCISKETVIWCMRHRRISATRELRRILK